MAHRRFTHLFRRRAPAARALAAIIACGVPRLLHSQAPTVPATPPPPVAPYRLPTIALVQPQDGGTVFQDRPVVVVRYVLGEAGDPIDASSFAIAVDDTDRTKLFQTSGTEAWGPLAASAAGQQALAVGAHRISARICSARGACATTQATISVIAAVVAGTPQAPTAGRSIQHRILDAALNAARRILIP